MKAERAYVLKHPLPEVTLKQLRSRLNGHTGYIGWLDARVADQLSASTGPFLDARWMNVVKRDEPIRWIRIREVSTRDDEAVMSTRKYDMLMQRTAGWREPLDEDPELRTLAQQKYRNVFGAQGFELAGIDRLVAEFACYDEWIQTDALVDPSGRYLSDRYAVSYSPSAAVYVALAEAPRPRANPHPPAVLAIGDPSFSIGAPIPAPNSRIDDIILRSALDRDPKALDQLPRLPYALHQYPRTK
jgi:hypothetical protein